MKLSVFNGPPIEVQFASEETPDGARSVKTLMAFAQCRMEAAKRARKNTADNEYELWCMDVPTAPVPGTPQLKTHDVVKALTTLLTFDGRKLNEAEFWEIIRGEYMVLYDLANWTVDALLESIKHEQSQRFISN